MKCEDCRALLSALLDGELSEHERAAVTEHLDGCDACRAIFGDLAAMHELLVPAEEADAPEGFSARVMQRVHAARMRRIRRRVSGVAACLVLVSALGLAVSGGLPGMMSKSEAPSGGQIVYDSEASSSVFAAPSDERPMLSTGYGTFASETATDNAPQQAESADANKNAETPQPVLRMVDSPAAEDFLASNALPDTLSEVGAYVSVLSLRALPDDVELIVVDDALSEDVLLNWAEDSTVYVELVEITEVGK